MELPNLLIRDAEKRLKTIITKLTHDGQEQLDKDLLKELRQICKASNDEMLANVTKNCLKCLRKDHSQVRVATVKLFNYLFNKSHAIRKTLIDRLDLFLELTLAISMKPDVKLKLPPPKRYANLMKELTAKYIYQWHADYGPGYERLRYTYKFLREHKLVDFNQFRVRTREQIIQDKMIAEKQERVLNQSIQNRLEEFAALKPEMDQLIVQIESSLEALIPDQSDMSRDISNNDLSINEGDSEETQSAEPISQNLHGFVNLNHTIDISFSPYLELERNVDNKETIEMLKELKKQLIDSKLTQLIYIEKVITKRSEQFVSVLKEIIDVKTKCTNLIKKLSELKIIDDHSKHSKTLDKADSDSEDSDSFEEVTEKEDLESYIPKSMRYEYGLEPIDPRELHEKNNSIKLVDEILKPDDPVPSSSGCDNSNTTIQLCCNVKLSSGKLCPRRDKIKCPFHGLIIARDHNGIPVDEEDRRREELQLAKKKPEVPDWQDPELLEDIRLAIGVDLRMPEKNKRKQKGKKESKLLDKKTCDVTAKQRLERKLKKLAAR